MHATVHGQVQVLGAATQQDEAKQTEQETEETNPNNSPML
jgi:hypothetical protein